MFIFCLTNGTMSDLHCIGELICAAVKELFIVPVQVDADFAYPGCCYYEGVRQGKEINLDGYNTPANTYIALEHLIKGLFDDIALPFNANACEKSIVGMAQGIQKRYLACRKAASSAARNMFSVSSTLKERLHETEIEDLSHLLQELIAAGKGHV